MEILTAFAIGLTFAAGVYQVLQRNVIRSAIGLMMMSNGISLYLLSTGAWIGEKAAYVGQAAGDSVDPLPQALILTAIVISLGLTAFILAVMFIVSRRYKTCDSDELTGLTR